MIVLSENERIRLGDAAREAAGRAYAPYSGYRVGAAVLTEKGNFYTGCNVENASYGLTLCAERAAIAAAVAAEGPGMRIKAITVAAEAGGPCPPCGACRQVIYEFGPEALVLFQGEDGLKEMQARELLPEGFRLP